MNREIGLNAVEHMKNRRSVRVFKDKKIPDEDLKMILEAGLAAATGGNLQPYSIIVERDKEKNKMLSELCGSEITHPGTAALGSAQTSDQATSQHTI